MTKLLRSVMLLIACTFTAINAFAQTDSISLPGYVNPTGSEFPIVTYNSFIYEHLITPENYKILKDGGFNVNSTWMQDNNITNKILTASKGLGIKTFIKNSEVHNNLQSVINTYMTNPEVIGVFAYDEPSYMVFKHLGEQCKEFYNSPLCRNKLFFVNLFPNYASPKQLQARGYDEYLREFVKIVGAPVISFDNYPFHVKNGISSFDSHFYMNLEQVAKVCQKYNIPFWSFILSAKYGDFPEPTEGMMSFEANFGLAYGSQGIQYFGYASRDDEQMKTTCTPINGKTGKPGKTYYIAQRINREIQNLAPYLLGAKFEKAWYTGEHIPKGTWSLSHTYLPKGISKIKGGRMGFLVTQLKNHDKTYIMVVNRDYMRKQAFTIEKDANVTTILPDGTIIQDTKKKYAVNPGKYVLFELAE